MSGFWHGANWTFIAWGAFHAVCFLPLLLRGKNRKYTNDIVAEGRLLPRVSEALEMAATFFAVVIGWVFFRAPDISAAAKWLVKMFSLSTLTIHGTGLGNVPRLIMPLAVLLLLEWFNRGRDIPRLPKLKCVRWCIYLVTILFCLGSYRTESEFIYFQF